MNTNSVNANSIDIDNSYQNSYKYFENRECKYYPCHKAEHINCLFCYCPFHFCENCPGTPEYIERNGKKIKSCMNCTFPHKAENYETVMKILAARNM